MVPIVMDDLLRHKNSTGTGRTTTSGLTRSQMRRTRPRLLSSWVPKTSSSMQLGLGGIWRDVSQASCLPAQASADNLLQMEQALVFIGIPRQVTGMGSRAILETEWSCLSVLARHKVGKGGYRIYGENIHSGWTILPIGQQVETKKCPSSWEGVRVRSLSSPRTARRHLWKATARRAELALHHSIGISQHLA